MNTPTTEQKIEQYEKFLHNINLMMICGNRDGIQKLLNNADNWSYSHRKGEFTDEERQEAIDKAFWKLNNINLYENV